jgi:hypothetical protein
MESVMALSNFKAFKVTPDIKPVVRIESDGQPVIISADGCLAEEIANRYCAYVKFLSATTGTIRIQSISGGAGKLGARPPMYFNWR